MFYIGLLGAVGKTATCCPLAAVQVAAWQGLAKRKNISPKYSLKQVDWRGLPSYPRNPLGSLSFLKLARLLLIESMKKFFSALNHRGTRDLKG